MKVYITKYALTRGIIIAEAEKTGDYMILVKHSTGWMSYYHKGEWADNQTDAFAIVNDMLEKKIVSLEKKLEKYRNFKVKIKDCD